MYEEILNYTQQVKNGTYPCPFTECPDCKEVPHGFSRHDCRSRLFYCTVEGGMVRRVKSLITRWKCPLCGSASIAYPDFALPNKRYVKKTIFEKCTTYLEDDLPEDKKPVSYEKAVEDHDNNRPIFYHSEETEPYDDRSLSPSTLHRWISTLSSFSKTCRRALQLIKQKSSTSPIFRTILPVARRKYRSTKRKKALESCLRLLQVKREFEKIFNASIFPNFAIRCQRE